MNSDTMAAVDLGGTHLRVAVFDADGGELFRHRIDTPADRPESLVGLIQHAVASVTAEVTSAVVAMPGPLSYQEGRPFILPNLPGWAPHISNALLTEALGFTAVIVHDTDLGVLGEHTFGAGRGVDDLVCITVSTGVGAGVGLGGRLVRGQRALATVETI